MMQQGRIQSGPAIKAEARPAGGNPRVLIKNLESTNTTGGDMTWVK